MRRPGLAHQPDLGGEASGLGVLQQSRHCVVVQVIDEIPDPGLVCCAQLACSQRQQRGTQGPSPAEITVAGGTQWQLWLQITNGTAETNESFIWSSVIRCVSDVTVGISGTCASDVG